jgi:hypothetical protein
MAKGSTPCTRQAPPPVLYPPVRPLLHGAPIKTKATSLSFFFNCLLLVVIVELVDFITKQNSMELLLSRIQNSSRGREGAAENLGTDFMIRLLDGTFPLILLALLGVLICLLMSNQIRLTLLIQKGFYVN